MSANHVIAASISGLVVVAAAVACKASPPTPDQDGSQSAATSPHDSTLVIEVNQPAGEWRTYTLRCDPASGTHPTPEAACGVLADLQPPLGEVAAPADRAVCEPLPSLERAVISGRWKGEDISVKFDRRTTCSARVWDLMGIVFVPVQELDEPEAPGGHTAEG